MEQQYHQVGRSARQVFTSLAFNPTLLAIINSPKYGLDAGQIAADEVRNSFRTSLIRTAPARMLAWAIEDVCPDEQAAHFLFKEARSPGQLQACRPHFA
jgi:hypothetical protein